jgi:hypothetical protein
MTSYGLNSGFHLNSGNDVITLTPSQTLLSSLVVELLFGMNRAGEGNML